MIRDLLCLSIVLTVGGCMSAAAPQHGTPFDASQVTNIEMCVTTESDLHRMFGSPYHTGVLSGYKQLSWQYRPSARVNPADSASVNKWNQSTQYLIAAVSPKTSLVVDYVYNPPAATSWVQNDNCKDKEK